MEICKVCLVLLAISSLGCSTDGAPKSPRSSTVNGTDGHAQTSELESKGSAAYVAYPNTKEALPELEQSGRDGSIPAQMLLGNIYEEGKIVPRDLQRSYFWYNQAAKNGSVSAQEILAGKNYKGEGVPKDLVLAYFWWRVAELHYKAMPISGMKVEATERNAILALGELPLEKKLLAIKLYNEYKQGVRALPEMKAPH